MAVLHCNDIAQCAVQLVEVEVDGWQARDNVIGLIFMHRMYNISKISATNMKTNQ